MRTAVAVVISDVHYSLKTLELADAAMRLAIAKANELDVPLIVAGDLHDTKANMRAECVSAMIKTFNLMNHDTFVLRGNHDQVNEKSTEHSLDFLGELIGVYIMDEPDHTLLGHPVESIRHYYFIPYHHDADEIRAHLKMLPKGSTLIMHQGLQSSDSGDYIQDHSAINPEDVAGMRVISGHYHNRQTIALPDGGQWDYVGNPYTLSYGEANDPPKGYQVLYNDGSLEFVPTNLRKHIKWDVVLGDLAGQAALADRRPEPGDLLWMRVYGPSSSLANFTKDQLKEDWSLDEDFRLELIPDAVEIRQVSATQKPADIFDSIIDDSTAPDDQKERLKTLWKDLSQKDVK